MSAPSYELGGIFKAIQDTTKPKSKKKIKEEEHEEKEDNEGENTSDILANLFAATPVEQPRTFTEEDIKDYITKDLFQEGADGSDDSDNESDTQENEATKRKPKIKWKKDPVRDARTVFVGNVAVSVTRKTLKKLFSKFGEVETVRIRSVPSSDPKVPKKVALIKKEFHAERNNMNAYVVFKSEDGANKSLQCNGTALEGLHLRIDKCANKEHDHKRSIFVGNLPFSCSEEAIRDHFKGCDTIDDVRLIRDKASGIGKGFGYIRFQSADGVMFGLKLNGSKFLSRKLRVFRSKEQTGPTGVVRNKEQRNFGGLRTTSKKDMEKGKKLFGSMKTAKKPSNALRRIQSRQNQKQTRNKERNLNRKGNKVK